MKAPKFGKTATSLILVNLFILIAASGPRAWAQNDFPEEEFDDPGNFNQPGGGFPPPPPPPSLPPASGAPPPPDIGPEVNNLPPSGPGGGSSFGTGGRVGRPPGAPGAARGARGARGGQGGSPAPAVTKPDLAHAGPEDITDANYPDMIESFDYPNADIKDVIKAISELTGKNFILDNNVSGKITIIAPTRITVAEAYKAFLSALAINGLTIVPSGKFLKVTGSGNARKNNIETYSGTYYPTSDIMITRIVSLKYISAKDLNDRLKPLVSKDGDINVYEQTNSLIIADYGSNVERLTKIVDELDKPGFEEQLEVILLKHAKARDIADIVMQVINKESSGGKNSRFAPRIPRFTPPGTPKGGGAEQLSMVAPDDRTNGLIVLGNKPGLDKVKALVKKLDYALPPEDAGGIFVYYVKYAEAEKLAATLNNIATDANKNKPGGQPGPPQGFPGQPIYGPPGEDGSSLFGGEVKIAFEKLTNSLIITASKTDLETVKNLLSKIDIPRDQVFVEAVIMELSADRKNAWGISYYQFAGDQSNNVVGRSGVNAGNSLSDLLDPTGDTGAILSFANGSSLKLKSPTGQEVSVTSFLGFLKFLTTTTENTVLSNPRIVASNNEEATIEVGQKVPVAPTSSVGTGGTTVAQGVQFENATIKLIMTPYISPNDDTVRMKIEQTVADVQATQGAGELSKNTQTLNTRAIKTNISVKSGDTAVLGGLVRNKDDVSITKVPLLGDIPILGWLFKGQTVSHKRSNLVVFLTPKIMRSLPSSHQTLDRMMNERIDFVKEHMRGEDIYGKYLDSLPRRAEDGSPEPQPLPKMPQRDKKAPPGTDVGSTPSERGEVEGNTEELINETLRTM